jgi:hypothetical protein
VEVRILMPGERLALDAAPAKGGPR